MYNNIIIIAFDCTKILLQLKCYQSQNSRFCITKVLKYKKVMINTYHLVKLPLVTGGWVLPYKEGAT